MGELILFLLIPISSILLLFLKDMNKNRKEIMNILLIMNALLFLSPLFMAYANTPKGESMWSAATGSYMWLYIVILPTTILFQFILLLLKILFALGKPH